MRLAIWLCGRLLRLAGVARRNGQVLPPAEPAGTSGPVSPGVGAEKRPGPALRLTVEVLDTREGAVVRLRGEAGVVEAGALEASLLPLVARRPACVTFDLSGLLFLSSLAMGVLSTFRRAAVRAGGRVCLAPDLRPAVREALERAELIGLFDAAGGAEPGVGPARKPYPGVHDVERAYGVAWGQLVDLEPRVEPLLWRARTAGGTCRTLTDVSRAFGPLRNELAGLIGFMGRHHRHPVLGSVGAYEVAYWKLYDAVAGLLPRGAGAAPEALEDRQGGTVPGPGPGESGAPREDAGFFVGTGI
jgi:anti-anti-sigma factor